MKPVRICPKCGSTNIGADCTTERVVDFCKDCGYGSTYRGGFPGPMLDVDTSMVEKIIKEIKRRNNK
jgi:hypothetical protein